MSLENPLLGGASNVDWQNVVLAAEQRAIAEGTLPEFRDELTDILRRLDKDYTGITSFAAVSENLQGQRRSSVRASSVSSQKPGNSAAA